MSTLQVLSKILILPTNFHNQFHLYWII